MDIGNLVVENIGTKFPGINSCKTLQKLATVQGLIKIATEIPGVTGKFVEFLGGNREFPGKQGISGITGTRGISGGFSVFPHKFYSLGSVDKQQTTICALAVY